MMNSLDEADVGLNRTKCQELLRHQNHTNKCSLHGSRSDVTGPTPAAELCSLDDDLTPVCLQSGVGRGGV